MKDRSELDVYLASGVDLTKRRLYFGDIEDVEDGQEFSWGTVEKMIRAMHKMYDISSAPIEIHMSSFGGEVNAMLRLVDEIEASPVQIKFFGGGQIMSAATWVMAVCDHRVLHKSAKVMIHDGSISGTGNHTDYHIEAEDDRSTQDKLHELFAANSRMPKEFWQSVCQRDLYISADEAVKLGIADEIIQPRKRGNVRKARAKALSRHPSSKEMSGLVGDLFKRIKRYDVPKIVVSIKKDETDSNLSDQVSGLNPDSAHLVEEKLEKGNDGPKS